MELRVLSYFLAVAREQSIVRAAQSLNLSQPTLSTQLKNLENELGKQLLIRGTKGSRKVTLTEDGMILRKRAEEILHLVRQAENEIMLPDKTIAGNIYIGAGETDAVRFLAKAQKRLQKEYPLIHFHMHSGDRTTIMEELERGLIEFALVFGNINLTKYDSLKLPALDSWGVIMRKDDPLAQKEFIEAKDICDKPLILSRQESTEGVLFNWLGRKKEEINRVATYSLLYNGSLMVEEGIGYALCLDKIINVSGDSRLCFRPLYPELKIEMHIIWKKYQIFSKASAKYLEVLKSEIF